MHALRVGAECARATCMIDRLPDTYVKVTEMGDRMALTRRGFVTVGAAGIGAAGAGMAGVTALMATPAHAEESADSTGGAAVGFEGINQQDESYDTYTTDFSAVFSPIQIGGMNLRNRICKSAAGSDTKDKEHPDVISQNTLDYYGRMADGGTSLIVLESGILSNFGMSPTTDDSELPFEDPEDGVEAARPLADRVHQAGTYIGYQISWGGLGSECNEPTTDEIWAFVDKVMVCARRLRDAGYDFVEIKGATNDGLNSFMSRRINQREDEFGPQSLENRLRLFTEMVKACKKGAGEDFPVLALINGLEENDSSLGQNDKYITSDEACTFAAMLEAAGVDAIQVRIGTPGMELGCWAKDIEFAARGAEGLTGFGTRFNYAQHFEGMLDGAHSGAGIFIPLAAKIKQSVSVPVGCACYMDPRTAPDLINSAVADGKIDLVYMTRPLTVDPELPNKLQEGRRDEVAPCCRCLHCHGNIQNGAIRFPEACRVNATTQHAYKEEMPEGYDPLPAETPKKVAVIGGGPAGMEAARVAAQRGHTVTLYEKNGYLGGRLVFAAAIKGPHERLDDLNAYLQKQLELNGVEVVTGQEADVALIADQGFDVAVVATGGARSPQFQGEPGVVQMDDVASAEIGEKVVILGAGVQATDLTLWLLEQGKEVQLVHGGTVDDVDKEQSAWMRLYVLPYVYASGTRVWNGASVTGLAEGGVNIVTDGGVETFLACDTVIECQDMVPNTGLADELASAGIETVTVGDCAVPYNIQQAIYTANTAARAL